MIDGWHTFAQDVMLAAGSIAAIGFMSRSIRRSVKSIIRVHAAVDAIQVLINAQLQPNGGSSIVDKIDRIEEIVADVQERVTILERKRAS